MASLTLFGWPVSPYTEKTRAWLRFKGFDTDEVEPTLWTLRRTVQPAVGRVVMPTVLRADGAWLSDSRHILDTLEAERPEPATQPSGPRQRVVSALLELFGDEWLVLAALHYRWQRAGNVQFAIDAFAGHGLPFVPRALARRLIRPVAHRMAAYQPKLGLHPHTISGIEALTEQTLVALDAHLAERPFLLGTRPCVGDFAMFGSIWAHLERDPHSTYLFDDTPHVLAWTARLREPTGDPGTFLPDDEVPSTLGPLLALAMDPWPHLVDTMEEAAAWLGEHPDATRLPRSLGEGPFHLFGREGTRKRSTFPLWKAERVVDVVAELPEAAHPWLAGFGGHELLAAPTWPRQRMEGHRLVLA